MRWLPTALNVRVKRQTLAIEHALATIESSGREPDLWEREFLRQAIGWLYRGGYRSSAINAVHEAFQYYRRMKDAGGFLPDLTREWFDP